MKWTVRVVLAGVIFLLAGILWSAQPRKPIIPLAKKAFVGPDLYISTQSVPLEELQQQLPNAAAWAALSRQHGAGLIVHIDPRSGTPSSLMDHFPVIPGSGVDNHLKLDDLSRLLGRPVKEIDRATVGESVRQFLVSNRSTLGIDLQQLGAPVTAQVTDALWVVNFPQQVDGVPVRHSRLLVNINHGNVVLLGTEYWGNAHLSTHPRITAEEAVKTGFDFADGRQPQDILWRNATLEIVPVTPPGQDVPYARGAAVGRGYGHRLVWAFGFQRPPEIERWEVLVDAHTGTVISFRDTNTYEKKRIEGGAYPITNIDQCASVDKCGTMQPGSPMPWADTGLASPNNFTNSAGIFDYTSGTVTTTLQGKYVTMSDACGNISEGSSTGRLDLLGTTGQHDCVSARTSPGDTAATRTSFYETNKIAELARGWLPANAWLQGQLPANTNIPDLCNAYWDGVSINFFRSGGGCRNTGELAAVIDHEWGHGLDDNDALGVLSDPSEAYADIAAAYHLQASCMGYGFWQADQGFECGQTADGTGYNYNHNDFLIPHHCALDCSGVRETDWDKHADHQPDTPQNFVCGSCADFGTGPPCDKEVHCESAPTTQAAWDFLTRDLRTAPFNYDAETASVIANRIFYQGSGSVGQWHECSCTAGTSGGCGSFTGYKQWLAADDNNGNITDGTPHMTALYNAFNRHGLACATPTPVNSGCVDAPHSAPTLTVTPSTDRFQLSWTSVSGAAKYWVLRSEGQAGCAQAKTLIASPTTTSYTDLEVADGRQYCYAVTAVGGSDACFGGASACACSTLPCTVPGSPTLVAPANGATAQPGDLTFDWNDVAAATSYRIEVATDSGFNSIVRTSPVLLNSEWKVEPSLDSGTTYYWRAFGVTSCGNSLPSAVRSLTVCSGALAAYDASLFAPRCSSSTACSCDSAGLVNSRDNIQGTTEPNQPNTLQNSCADGTTGTYHVDPSVDRVEVRTVDGSTINAQDLVTLKVTGWCQTANNHLYLYYTSNASSPSWTTIASGLLCGKTGQVTFYQSFTLANVSGTHAVRAQLLPPTAPSACANFPRADRDDLAFQVAPRPPRLCVTDYCAAEGTRCYWSGNPVGCCDYSNCQADPTCIAPDPLPPFACQ